MRVTAVILAAGRGERFGTDHPKQLLKIAGKTVLEHTLEAVQAVDDVDEILIITQEALVSTVRDLAHRCGATKTRAVLIGGATRNDSTRAALAALADREDGKVLTHDAVRPFVDERIIQDCIDALDEVEAVDVAIRSADTIIRVDGDHIVDIPDRGLLRRGQTPQAFRLATLAEAYRRADTDPDFSASDDCSIVRKYLPDVEIRVVEGSETNIKITHPIDVYLADKLFQLRTLEAIEFDRDTLEEGLRGTHIAIVGGSSGIGASIGAMAENLGAHCHLVSRELTGTHVERIDEVRSAFDAIAAETGRIDHVVTTAGLLSIKALDDQTDEEVRELIDINYLGTINVARAALPHLTKTRGQLLCFTSSSFTRGRANYALYSSSKAAVVNLVQALAEEWSDLGVSINCMNPERTLTPMRTANFGNEDPDTLLSAERVAEASLRTLVGAASGQVIDVRR